MERLKPVSIPLIAVPMSVTATMPMITPSAVRKERVRLAAICAYAILQLSTNSKRRRFMSGLDRQLGMPVVKKVGMALRATPICFWKTVEFR